MGGGDFCYQAPLPRYHLCLGDPFVVLLNAQADGGLPMMHWAFQLVSLVRYFLPTLPRSCHCGGYLIGFLSLIPHSVQCL